LSRRPDQLLGARVVLTAWVKESEPELIRALEELSGPTSLTTEELPVVVLAHTSRANGEHAKELLERAGGTVSLEDVWVTRQQAGDARPRSACPACGSARTQPYLHAGPGARVNMKCNECGRLFRGTAAR
jgi:hypothetical protein